MAAEHGPTFRNPVVNPHYFVHGILSRDREEQPDYWMAVNSSHESIWPNLQYLAENAQRKGYVTATAAVIGPYYGKQIDVACAPPGMTLECLFYDPAKPGQVILGIVREKDGPAPVCKVIPVDPQTCQDLPDPDSVGGERGSRFHLAGLQLKYVEGLKACCMAKHSDEDLPGLEAKSRWEPWRGITSKSERYHFGHLHKPMDGSFYWVPAEFHKHPSIRRLLSTVPRALKNGSSDVSVESWEMPTNADAEKTWGPDMVTLSW